MTKNPPDPPHVQLRLSRAAVDALLGADPEAKVALTHQVVEHVAKQHVLKAVENDPTIQRIVGSVKEACTSEAYRLTNSMVADTRERYATVGKYELLEPLKSAVQAAVRKAIHDEVDATVKAIVGNSKTLIQERVRADVDYLVKCEVRDLVLAKFKEAMAKAGE